MFWKRNIKQTGIAETKWQNQCTKSARNIRRQTATSLVERVSFALNIKILLLQFLFFFRNKPDHHLWILRVNTTNNFWPTGHISDYWKIIKTTHTYINNTQVRRDAGGVLTPSSHVPSRRTRVIPYGSNTRIQTQPVYRRTWQRDHSNIACYYMLWRPPYDFRVRYPPVSVFVFEPTSYETAYQT